MRQDIFEQLAKSAFRSRFRLSERDRAYIAQKGLEVIRRHAEDFVARRLAPAAIENDGQQTPMCGHPVFVAQHATGTCCRGCLAKWHHIGAGTALSEEQQEYIVGLIMEWIRRQLQNL